MSKVHDDELHEENGQAGMAGGPEGDVPMSFWDHFAELRRRLTRAILSIVVGFGVAFFFAAELAQFLRTPLKTAWAQAEAPGQPDLQALGVQDALLVDFRVALMAGIFLALPVIFYQLWMFISPGLYSREKRFVIPFVLISAIMFVTGAWFAYEFVLPYGYAFMIEYSNTRGVQVKPELANYIKGTTRILLAFGVVFEFPLLIAFLAKAGVVTNRTLMRYWRIAVLVIFILAAFLTPPEPMTQVMMAGPMVVLFFVSVGVAYLINPYKEPEPFDDEIEEDSGHDEAP